MGSALAMALLASVFAVPVQIAVHPSAVRTGATAAIEITWTDPLPADAIPQWSATAGNVQSDGKGGYAYTAPDQPGRAFIHLAVISGGAPWAECAAPVQVYRQFVMLKADDLSTATPESFARFLNYADALRQRGIKTSMGMIADLCATPTAQAHDQIVGMARSGFVEFWNHGYDHACYLPSGDKRDWTAIAAGGIAKQTYPEGTTYEFRGRPYEEQLDHLTRAQQTILDTYGIRMRSFGAPFNETDANTAKALHDLGQVDIWLFARFPDSVLRVLSRGGGEIEDDPGVPSLSKFLATYNSSQPLVVLQHHPMEKTFTSNWDQFTGILDKVVANGSTFILPGEYADLMSKGVVPNDPKEPFVDPALEFAVRKALNQWTGPVDATVTAALTSLQYTGQTPQIRSLAGIGALTGVRSVDFRGNDITDPTPIVDLWHAVGGEMTVHLENNPLSDDFTCNQIPLLDADGLHISFTGPCDNVRLRLVVDGQGTLNPAIGDHVVARNAVITVRATPGAGYVFSHWTGDLAGTTANPANVVADAAKTAGAVFSVVPPPDLQTAAQRLVDGFTTADTDHSSALGMAEAAAAIPGLTQSQFNQMDANGDGQVTQNELDQFLNPNGCNCFKSESLLGGFKNRMADLFLSGLAVLALLAFSACKPRP
jgi:peptidoglycan/xylan/chitin deacetylase (PgdA/CDA1 family)